MTVAELKALLRDVPDDYIVYADYAEVAGVDATPYPDSLWARKPGTLEIEL